MKFIGDFHIHSHFSIATSKQLQPEYLEYWARYKGIKVVGTGDFTHPGWTDELKEKLEPAEHGLFKVKTGFKKNIPFSAEDDVRFILTAEISNIYKKNGKVRKVHNVVFAPSFDVVDKIQAKLSGLGFNITSDGRPILGLDSRNLLELCLEASQDIFFVPAHIWTPWFSVLGSKSGFDSVEECFDDLSDHISAIETGLSTDPPMNWMVSSLDNYTLIANSDAHSPEKLGRNANLFNTELSYKGIINAMKTGDPEKFLGTIDFFPQEGKYHYDGHRKCGIRWSPLKTLQHNEICPVCGKKITVGVMNRIAQLADRDDVLKRKNRHPFYSLIPLKEILSEIENVGPNSKKIAKQYENLIRKAGSEFNLLLHYDMSDVVLVAGEVITEAIRRMRNREVYISEGFDGEYGVIKVFKEGESKDFTSQEAMFAEPKENYKNSNQPRPLISFDIKAYRKLKEENPPGKEEIIPEATPDLFNQIPDLTKELNPEQRLAVRHHKGPALILAGPGTGKTKVLTTRIANLIQNFGVDPKNILAVTFTNKAANEMRERLADLLGDRKEALSIRVSTFHAFGLSVLKKYFAETSRQENFSIIDEENKKQILLELGIDKSEIANISESISNLKQHIKSEKKISDKNIALIYKQYNEFLIKINAFDFDDLMNLPVNLFEKTPEILSEYKQKLQWILVDEYQDVNYVQYQLIRLLMPDENANLFVIGDPNQAIYGFRGADVQYIRQFKEDYPEAAIYELKKSYRCSDSILQASGNILSSHSGFLEGLQKGVKINISENATEKSEAEFIARTVEQMIGGVGFFSMDSSVAEGNKEKEIESLSDFAVLCRIGKQMNAIEKAFKDHNIPYQKIGEVSFLKQEPVRSVTDLLQSVFSPQNFLRKKRLIKRKIITEAELVNLHENLKEKSLTQIIDFIIEKYFKKEKTKNELAFNRLKELALESQNDTERFFNFISLGTGIDVWKPNIEAVNIMTLHASKGLEFNCVFIAGCEDGLLPYNYSNLNLTGWKKPARFNNDIEEEQRLLYVGMTRAKNYLFLTHAKKRFLMGKEYQLERSPFLDKIEKELIEAQKQEYKRKEKKEDNQLELF